MNILNITSLNVTTDIIESSYTDGTAKNIIYSFFPTVGPRFKIVQEPSGDNAYDFADGNEPGRSDC